MRLWVYAPKPLPILIAKWHLTPWEIGFLIGSGSVGQLIGAFVFPWYAERKGRVRAIALSSGIACGFITAYVYTPELYSTSIRAMGCGVGGAWLKVAAIFAPAIVSKTMIGGNLEVAFYILAAVPVLAAITVHLLGIETKGKVLEQLEA